MNTIKQWFAARKAAEKERQRQDGYNYAAGQLLHNGEDAAAQLSAEHEYLTSHKFDEGVHDALVDYERQQAKHKRVAEVKIANAASAKTKRAAQFRQIEAPYGQVEAGVKVTAPTLMFMPYGGAEWMRLSANPLAHTKRTECWPTGRTQRRYFNEKAFLDIEVKTPSGEVSFVPVRHLSCEVNYPPAPWTTPYDEVSAFVRPHRCQNES